MVDVTPNSVIDFQNNFDDVAENKKAQLLMTSVVTEESMDGKVKAIDSIGQIDAREITGRVVAVTFDDIDHLRRQLATKRYALTLPIDNADVQDIARDPSGKYAERCVTAFNRQIDDTIITAALADVLTGEDMSTTVTAVADGVVTVDATAGMTYEKLREIKATQGSQATGTDYMEQAVLAITDSEADDLLAETQLTSGDFDRLFSRDDNGSLVKALGMDIVQFPSLNKPLLAVNGGVRSCLAFAGDAMAFGMHTAPMVDIKDLDDQYYETKGVFIVGRFGSTRREGVRVIEVTTTA